MQRGRAPSAVIVAFLCAGTLTVSAMRSAGASPPAVASRKSTSFARDRRAVARTAVRTVAAGGRARRVSLPSTIAVARAAVLATTASRADPIGDNPDGFEAMGDLTDASVSYGTAALSVRSVTQQFDDPSTSYNWRGFALNDPNFIAGTALTWGLDTNLDDKFDFQVALFNDGTNVIAGVTSGDGMTLLCPATPSWDAATESYSVRFARSCVGSPARVRAQSLIVYETSADLSLDVTAWTNPVGPPQSPAQTEGSGSGYWMLGADGHVYPFGGALGFPGRVAGAKAMAPRRNGKGYWVVDAAGHVFTYGSARFFGAAPKLARGEFVSTISATPDDRGYWLFTNRGRAFPFGDAQSFGDMSATRLNGPIVASVATPSGHGYYMVGSDGGIFSFGDARFHGSTGGTRLNRRIVGISPTPNGQGYWLVASDGGVFAFNAAFRGSMGGAQLNKPVDGIVAYGNGYLMVASDGGVFDFSETAFLGSLANTPPTAPIIGLAGFTA